MKINEKWMLFLIATFTTFFGVVDTLLKGTSASELSINEAFSDINFYKCVVDAYNNLNDTDYDYKTTILSDEELSLITGVECSGYDKEEYKKVTNVKGIEKLVSLNKIDLSDNNLSEVDLSENIYLSDFKIDLVSYVYENDIVNLYNSVKLPKHLINSIEWISGDNAVASVENNEIVNTLSPGSVIINGQIDGGATINNFINVVGISTDKYMINEVNSFIYIGHEDIMNIVNDIDKSFDDISVGVDESLLHVKYNEQILKEFKIYDIDFLDYKVIDKNVNIVDDVNYNDFVNNLVYDDDIDLKIFDNDIEIVSGDILDGMELRVYYNEILLDTYRVEALEFEFDSDIDVDNSNKYIKYLPSGTTVDILLDTIGLVDYDDIIIYNNENVRKYNSSVVATGDILKIYLNGEVINQYELSVMGDSSGDGVVDLVDLLQIRKHLVGWENELTGEIKMMTGVYYYALDFNRDGKVDLLDLVKIRKNIVGMI